MPPGLRILIVEDEELLAENLRAYLLKRMADVRVAGSGEAAIECAREFRPDLIMLDYGLPGIDGLETFARVKGFQWRCGCLLMTANPVERVRMAAQAAGISQILEKPFSLSEIDAPVMQQLIAPAYRAGTERRLSKTRRAIERRDGPLSSPPHRAESPMMDERRRGERRDLPDRRRPGLGGPAT